MRWRFQSSFADLARPLLIPEKNINLIKFHWKVIINSTFIYMFLPKILFLFILLKCFQMEFQILSTSWHPFILLLYISMRWSNALCYYFIFNSHLMYYFVILHFTKYFYVVGKNSIVTVRLFSKMTVCSERNLFYYQIKHF